MNKIYPCLWFDKNAEEAAKFYTSTFKNSKIGKIARYGKSGSNVSGQDLGSVMTVEFEIEGMKILGLNGGPQFKFTPAVSFFVSCENEKEVNEIWQKLKGGRVLFELQKYPWSEKYGWCEDKFGVSWQIMLSPGVKQKVIPSILFTEKLLGKAEQAVKFYTSVFKNSKIESMHKDPSSNHVMFSRFALDGQEFALMEGPGNHEISLATSLIVNCKNQDEVDYFWNTLIKDGGEPSQCGWLKDKYGLSWQIIPNVLGELMSGSDPKKSENVMKEMLKMKKLDIEKLKAAYK